jgi:hypothetical protein
MRTAMQEGQTFPAQEMAASEDLEALIMGASTPADKRPNGVVREMARLRAAF